MRLKNITIGIGVIASAQFAHASGMRCVETEKSKTQYNYSGQIEVSFGDDGEALEFTVYDNSGKNTANGTAKLDHEFKDSNDLRYVDSKAIIGNSDGEAEVLVTKGILKGKKGHLVVSGNQANDGESGPALLWFTDGEFDCEK